MQPYVSNGLRALGRLTSASAVVAVTAASVFGQGQVTVEKGIYVNNNDFCAASPDDGKTRKVCYTTDDGKITRSITRVGNGLDMVIYVLPNGATRHLVTNDIFKGAKDGHVIYVPVGSGQYEAEQRNAEATEARVMKAENKLDMRSVKSMEELQKKQETLARIMGQLHDFEAQINRNR